MIPNIKNFDKEIARITEIENLRSHLVRLEGHEGKSAITKIKKEFHLESDGVFRYPDNGKLGLYLDDEFLVLTSSDFDSPFDNAVRPIPAIRTFDIDGLCKGELKDSGHFRMFFFDTSKTSHLFWKKLESPNHNDRHPWSFNCVRIDIGNKLYDISQYGKNPKFIVIENLDSVSRNDFTKDSYAIQKGIGFLCGYMPGGEHYIFSGESFEYSRLSREALKSVYYPVTANPYSFVILHNDEQRAKKYDKILKEIPSQVISNLVTQIRDSEELSVAILFLMEVAHLKSVVSMPGVFSVILESLANSIITPAKVTSQLIPDKELVEDMVRDLNEVLDKYTPRLDTNAMIKLRRRLPGLNRPLNPQRLTNAEKLREPFDQLGIILSASDERALDFRNYLLHGNILMNEQGQDRTSREIDDHMLYISAKLYTLISKLILKNSGFNGHVINHAKLYDYSNAVDDPEYFELI